MILSKIKIAFTGVFVIQLFVMSQCKKENIALLPPDILVNGSVVEVIEDADIKAVDLVVALSASFDKSVSLDYSTADSTAIAGRDYVPINSGKLVFQPGEVSKTIKVEFLADTAIKQDVTFRVILSNPVNGVLKRPKIIVKIINVDYSKLVWNEEFNSGPLNTTFWNYEQGATGWGNNELQNYTSSTDNVHIDTGYLHITALNSSPSSYTSGRITTKGKKEFTCLRVEIRAKLPEGKGIWPALWMLGGNISSVGWPKCGETDIMELLGNTPSTVHAAVHWDSNGHVSKTNEFTLSGGKFSTGFHKFSLIWTPNKLRWLVDDQEYFNLSRTAISGFPLDLPQFFIFNVAVGGNWPGSPDQTTVFPQHMIVDYIRVYQ